MREITSSWSMTAMTRSCATARAAQGVRRTDLPDEARPGPPDAQGRLVRLGDRPGRRYRNEEAVRLADRGFLLLDACASLRVSSVQGLLEHEL